MPTLEPRVSPRRAPNRPILQAVNSDLARRAPRASHAREPEIRLPCADQPALAATSNCAATAAAMTAGSLPLISGLPIGQTSRCRSASEIPICRA
jgi:hypothetical protein